MKLSRVTIACLLAYALIMAAVTWLMFSARSNVLATYSTPEAQKEWEQWREKAWQQATPKERKKKEKSLEKIPEPEPGPQYTERKIPPPQPPALILMRDNFASCLIMVLLICSTIFGAFVFFLQGALAPLPQTNVKKKSGR